MATNAEILALTTVHGLSATQIRAMIPARVSKAAKAHLGTLVKARLDRDIAKGGIPKLPSRKLFEELTGEVFDFNRENQRTRKQIAAGKPTIAERKAKAKPSKRKGKAKSANAPTSVNPKDLAATLSNMPKDEVLAMFTKLFG